MILDDKKVKELVLVSLVTDSYCLGSHWVYDQNQLLKQNINWQELNNPLAIWHKGKKAGEFTHYGDQTYWLYEFLEDKEFFDENEFFDFWIKKMQSYNGYIDSATKTTLQNFQESNKPYGSKSSDLSIVGRFAPLLKVSKDKTEFLENVQKLTALTHNSQSAKDASDFFAKLFLEVLENRNIEKSILFLKDGFNSTIQDYIQKAFDSKNANTSEVMKDFGLACDISEGFSGVIHLLLKYDDYKQMQIANAKAGGETSARGMIAALIFMANKPISKIPRNWFNIKKTIN
ncbi:MAG: ADP-ribosylglycohydrolase family protein [Campylobacterota bacterium]